MPIMKYIHAAALFLLIAIVFYSNITIMDSLVTVRSIEQAISSVKSSAVVSKLQRMLMYEERYKYLPPKPYTNHSARYDLCGVGPNYDPFFTRERKERYQISSANREDETIYTIFFKGDTQVMGSVVEIGAYNGLQESNSHFYEVCLGWETLLVEGNTMLWEQIVANRPHAHRLSYAPSCSEEDEQANKTVKFDKYPMTNAGLADGTVKTSYSGRNYTIDVPCGSFNNVLLDILNGHVTFFSLDVEGAEPFVLQNIDFKRIFVDIMMVESSNNICERNCKSRKAYRKIMLDEGYILFDGMVHKSDVFIHPLSKHLKTAEKKGYTPSTYH
uniref:Methyltransferase FkbM domain-containing protein n=1 Tax=Ditylum brightwellii TaxID=49249 RepID=A0A6U3UCD0_9STRA|mmetsp:Transcript_40465/g.60691  ORF Transcript_40465/g.60691 Transcript_40465/m.60691 type:complete len:329 (+) Transcript_40465:306-1292(+)